MANMFFRKLLNIFKKDNVNDQQIAQVEPDSSQFAIDEIAAEQVIEAPSIENSRAKPCEADNQRNLQQELAEKLYRESGTSFFTELFPDHELAKFRSSRHHSRVFVSPLPKSSEYFSLMTANIESVCVGDYLRVKENGIFTDKNTMISEFDRTNTKLNYRDRLRVEEVFKSSATAPAYLKVEVVGQEMLLHSYLTINRKHVRTHDGQTLTTVAKDFELGTTSKKRNFGYRLQLVEKGYGYFVVLYLGEVAYATDLDIGHDEKGTDGCIVFGSIDKSDLSAEVLLHMEPIEERFPLNPSHSTMKYLPNGRYNGFHLEIIIKNSDITLCIFDQRKPKTKINSVNNAQINTAKTDEFVRIENGKYRWVRNGNIYVSCWYFEKKYNVKLNDVDVKQAAQDAGVKHEKKCRVEFESARDIWGDFVYMYPEIWLEQQSSRLW